MIETYEVSPQKDCSNLNLLYFEIRHYKTTTTELKNKKKYTNNEKYETKCKPVRCNRSEDEHLLSKGL